MKFWKLTLLAVLACFVASGVWAAEGKGKGKGPQKPTKEQFTALDSNKDGKLSCDEFCARADKAPADKKEEIKARMKKIFEIKDTNKDGSLSPEEFLATPAPPKGGKKAK